MKTKGAILIACMLLNIIFTKSIIADEAADMESFKKIKWQEGPCVSDIGSIAEIRVPAGYMLADQNGTKILMELCHNPVSGYEYGTLAPSDLGWYVVFSYSDTGHIRDDEKNSLDADAIMKALKSGTEVRNRERQKRGWSRFDIIGWEQPPRYNAVTNNLEWAMKGKDENGEVINFNTRLLGRKGVMSITLVANPENYYSILSQYQEILANYEYKSGYKYAEYRQGDKISQYGLSALVVGGATAVAVKAGTFKWLWKVIVVGFVAVVGFFKNLFSGKKK